MFERLNTPEEIFSFKLGSALMMEQNEIAVYETLITNAEARDASEVAGLLRQNLEQEKRALETARLAMKTIAQQGVAVGATA
jgi:ferritin-like metal-binding protein YciE